MVDFRNQYREEEREIIIEIRKKESESMVMDIS